MRKLFYKNIVYFLIIAITVYSSVACLCNKFCDDSFNVKVFIFLTVMMLFSYGVIEFSQAKNVNKIIILSAMMGICYFIFHNVINNSVLIFINGYGKFVSRYYEIEVVSFDVDKGSAFLGIGFVAVALCSGLMLLNKFLKREEVYLFFQAITIVMFLMVGHTPSFFYLVISICMLVFLKIRVWKLKGEILVKISAMLVALFVVTASLGTVFANAMMGKATSVKELQKQIENIVLNGFHYEISSKDNAIDNKKPEYDKSVIMTIKSEEFIPYESLYLKDFQGDQYVDSKWIQNDELFSKACSKKGVSEEEIQKMLQEGVFNAYKFNSTVRELNYTIDYKGLITDCAYVSYGAMCDKDVSVEGDFTAKKKLTKKSMSYKGVGSNSSSKVLANVLWSDQYERLCETKNENWDWYNKFVVKYTNKYEQIKSLASVKEDFESKSNLSWDIKSSRADNNFNYVNRSSSRFSLVSELANYFRENYKYDLLLDDVDEDPIDYFLGTSHKGFCVHFASAATMILQEYGVPARYVSGYVVNSGAFKKTGDNLYEAQVKDSNAHAWVEVYFDDIGWIPIEMTPGYGGGTIEEARRENVNDTIKKNEEKSQKDKEELEKESQQTESEQKESEIVDGEDSVDKKNDSSNSKSGNSKSGKTSVGKTAAIIGAIVFATLLILLLIIRQKVKIRRFFTRKARTRTALLRKHRRLYKTICHKKITANIRLKKIKDVELEQLLVNCYAQVSKEDWHRYMEVIKKAKFSTEDISKEEYYLCNKIYSSIIQ